MMVRMMVRMTVKPDVQAPVFGSSAQRTVEATDYIRVPASVGYRNSLASIFSPQTNFIHSTKIQNVDGDGH